MASPVLTLHCDCGTEGRSSYGARWTCPACGRVYDTSRIPAADYDAVTALDRRYRWSGRAVIVVLALIVLAVAVTGQLISIFAGLALVLLGWFLYIRPLVHRRHRRAVSQLTRSWELHPE
jgi:hypothetical protein